MNALESLLFHTIHRCQALLDQIVFQATDNYLYGLLGLSVLFVLWEKVAPWRKHQPVLRRGFWLDGWYMLWNYFIVPIVGLYSIFAIMSGIYEETMRLLGWNRPFLMDVLPLPLWLKLIFLFIVRDFIHFNIHRFLHWIPKLWEFHKVHHSVEQMGFAAYLRFHWVEGYVYRILEWIPLMLLGIQLYNLFILDMIVLLVGFFSHANVTLKLGWFKYLFNNPQMHLWHHAKVLPRRYGVNFGLTLSVWDYLFKTNYIPKEDPNEPLGFAKIETFPKSFLKQNVYGFRKQV